MPRRSRKTHNWLSIFAGAFAFLLIVSSFLISKNSSLKPFPIRKSDGTQISSEGLVAGATQDKNIENALAVDPSSWKKYRDPIYHFEIKYPSEWANPAAKKITDPDFDYEYQVSFGTAETIAGSGVEGFTVFVFPTEKCVTDNSGSAPKCATQKSKIQADTDSSAKIFEFSSKIYTYTVVPFIPGADTDPNLTKKINLELDEAQKTFVLDPNLQLVAGAKKTSAVSKPATPIQTPKAPAPSRIGRVGALTGAVKSGGKMVCPHPNRKPMRSPNKGNHVDEDCCPDPDEWPNIACAYKPGDYAIMLKL